MITTFLNRLIAKTKLLFILILCLILRLILIMKYAAFIHPQLWEYEEIANNLLSGKGFLFHHLGGVSYRSFNNPLYSFLCAGIYLITKHSFFAVLLIQALFSVLTAYFIFCIGRILFGERIGLISALLVACHPGLLYYDVFNLLPLSIDIFFIVFSVWLFLKNKDKPGIKGIFMTGLCIGLGVLSRGIIGAMLPFLAIYIILFFRNSGFRRKSKIILTLFLGAFLMVAPWIARNYAIHKKLLIISTFSETLWRGNNKYSTGTSLSKDGKPILDLWPEDFRKKLYSLDEINQAEFFRQEAQAFIKGNPGIFIKSCFKKLYYFWWFSPQGGILYPKKCLELYRYLYAALLLFSFLGIIITFSSEALVIRRDAGILISVLLAISFAQSLFYVEGRHRWLVEPLLILFFVYGIARFLGGINKEKNFGAR